MEKGAEGVVLLELKTAGPSGQWSLLFRVMAHGTFHTCDCVLFWPGVSLHITGGLSVQ